MRVIEDSRKVRFQGGERLDRNAPGKEEAPLARKQNVRPGGGAKVNEPNQAGGEQKKANPSAKERLPGLCHRMEDRNPSGATVAPPDRVNRGGPSHRLSLGWMLPKS